MAFGERIADESAAHYAELRQRRVPWPLSWFMAYRFHELLSRSVLMDDKMDPIVERILTPRYDEEVKVDA